MADNPGNDNIFAGLKGLIWSAFIGVVSFQLLAPNIWGYIHKLLGLPYICAYRIFIWCYLFAIPIIGLYWLFSAYGKLIKYFNPCEKPNEIDLSDKRFLNTIFIYIGGLAALTGLLLLISVPFWLYGFLQLLSAVTSLYLLYSGSSLSYQCIEKFPAATADSRLSIRRNFRKMVLVCGVIYLILALTGTRYLAVNGKKNYMEGDTLHTSGFRFLALRDNIDSVEQDLGKISDSLKAVIANAHLAELRDTVIDTSTRSNRPPDTSKARKTKYPPIVSYIADSMDKVVYRSTDTMLSLLTMIRADPDERQGRIAKDSIRLTIKDLQPFSDSTHRNFDSASSAGLEYLTVLLKSLDGIRKQVDNKAREELGKKLRATQVIGMLMLLGLLFTFLSLYIFLKASQQANSDQLNDLAIQKRINSARRLRSSNTLSLEKAIIDQEIKVSEVDGLSGNAWLFITVIIWLLIPFFKPVEDDKIDTEAPYKMLTFSGGANPLAQDPKTPPTPPLPPVDTIRVKLLPDTLYVRDPSDPNQYKKIEAELRDIKGLLPH